MKSKRFLVGLATFVGLAFGPLAPLPAVAADVENYWQCVASAPGVTPSWCPISTTYPMPTGDLDELAVSGSATSAATLFTQDLNGYQSISVQVTSAGTSSTITYEASDDNVNWVATSGISSSQVGATLLTISSITAILLTFPKRSRYFRARVSTYGSGTVTVVGNCHKNPFAIPNRLTVDGPAVHGVTVQGNVFPMGLDARNVAVTAVTTGQNTRAVGTLVGVPLQKPYAIPELDWAFASAASGIVNTTTAVTLVGAGAAGVKNYITALQIQSDTLGAATEIVIRNGAAGTVIWRGKLGTVATQLTLEFPTPLQSSAATLLEFATLTATVTGGVFVNAQGYSAAD